MIEEINININETVSTALNFSVITREVITDIINFSNIYNFQEIKTNGIIISNLMDNSAYSINNFLMHNDIHFIGILAGRIKIYMDTNMRWDDNRIIPIYDNNYLRSLKLNKIINKQIKYDILNEIKINNCDLWL